MKNKLGSMGCNPLERGYQSGLRPLWLKVRLMSCLKITYAQYDIGADGVILLINFSKNEAGGIKFKLHRKGDKQCLDGRGKLVF